MAGLWKARALALLLVRLHEPPDAEIRVQQALTSIADKIHAFGGRIEGVSPTGLVASFGLQRADEPVVLAAHSAMVIHNAFRRGEMRPARPLALVMGVHASELLVSDDPEAPTIDADGSRRAWNTLDALVEGAAPGTTVATLEAATLLRRRFHLAPRDARRQSYRVDGLWRVGAHGARDGTHLAGRAEELALLEGRLALAARSVSQVVDIFGEAGIGKSRLLLELGHRASAHRATFLEGRCSSATRSTPFYPILSILHAACGTVEGDGLDVLREKAAAAARLARVNDADTVPALAQLLSAELVPPFDVDLGALKRRFFRAVRELLIGLSHSVAPLFIAVEDLHWVDPTSEECLASLVEAFGASPIFFVTTYRPDYRPPWGGQSNVTQLALLPLSRDESREVVHDVVGSADVARDLVEPILARAEGNPLFLEELTRAALSPSGNRPSPRVPATIEEVIWFRMSRLQPRTLDLLGVAAVIGRETPVSFLLQVSELEAASFEMCLEELRRGEFVHEWSTRGAEVSCVFKHALLQETAYQRVPERERRRLHARVLDAMEQLFGERVIDHVEELAHHALMAEDQRRAVRYCLQAARKAAARSALDDAVNRLEVGIGIVRQWPDAPDRDREELGLQAALGIVLRASRGSAAPETERVLVRARDLCRRVGDFSQLGPVLVGQWFTFLLRAQYKAARELSDELRQLAQRDDDALLGVFAHRALGMTALHEGEFPAARRHLEESLALFVVEEHHGRAVREYGNDPYVSCLAYLGRALWSLGFPDQALARNREAVAHARERGAPLDVAAALTMLTSVHQLRRDIDETREATEHALAYARDNGAGYWRARNALLLSWAQAMGSSTAERDRSIAALRQMLDEYRATGTALGLSWFLTLLGQVYGASGQPGPGLALLDEATAHIDATGEGYHEAEVHGLRGELLLMSGADPALAEASFRKGLEVARRQESRAWELRVGTSLARLLAAQGRPGEARDLLAPVYGWFTEGFDTRDLRDARSVLRELNGSR